MVFGKLTVIKEAGRNRSREVLWECLCSCGNTSLIRTQNLKSGNSKSCGCSRVGNPSDLTNKKFGKLTAITLEPSRKSRVFWRCLCDCGNYHSVHSGSLVNGHTSSCGCLSHGMEGTPTYSSWRAMLQRCNNPNSTGYKNYGGRGITICNEWLTFSSFFASMGTRPQGTSLDRIEPNRNNKQTNFKSKKF